MLTLYITALETTLNPPPPNHSSPTHLRGEMAAWNHKTITYSIKNGEICIFLLPKM